MLDLEELDKTGINRKYIKKCGGKWSKIGYAVISGLRVSQERNAFSLNFLLIPVECIFPIVLGRIESKITYTAIFFSFFNKSRFNYIYIGSAQG